MTDVAVVVWLLVGAASAAHAEAPASPRIRIGLTDGQSLTGRFLSLDAKHLRMKRSVNAAPQERSISREQILRVDVLAEVSSRWASGPVVFLANGDRLSASPVKMDGENLSLTWPPGNGSSKVPVPLLSVRGILLDSGGGHSRTERPEAVILNHTTEHDLVVLRNGDRVAGQLSALGADSITMAGGMETIARKDIRAIAFNPKYVTKPKAPVSRTLIRLRDGSLLSATKVSMGNAGTLRVQTTFDADMTMSVDSLRSLQFLGKHIVPLSEMTPEAFEYTPFLDGNKPLKNDRNVFGGPLMLRGRIYDIGLGMHTRSRADYKLTGDERHFLATVGVDDTARGQGSVVFIVELDGQPVFKSDVVTGRDKPVPIGPLSLKGHRRLTLIADFGPHGDLLDYADWCDAVLVK